MQDNKQQPRPEDMPEQQAQPDTDTTQELTSEQIKRLEQMLGQPIEAIQAEQNRIRNMSFEEAAEYHKTQTRELVDSGEWENHICISPQMMGKELKQMSDSRKER